MCICLEIRVAIRAFPHVIFAAIVIATEVRQTFETNCSERLVSRLVANWSGGVGVRIGLKPFFHLEKCNGTLKKKLNSSGRNIKHSSKFLKVDAE